MLKSPCRPPAPAPAPALIQFQNSVMASMPLDVHRAAGARGDLDGQVGAVREGAEAVPVAPGQAHLVEQAGAIRGNNCVMRLRLYASAPFSATLRPYQYHRRQRHAPKTGLRHSWL